MPPWIVKPAIPKNPTNSDKNRQLFQPGSGNLDRRRLSARARAGELRPVTQAGAGWTLKFTPSMRLESSRAYLSDQPSGGIVLRPDSPAPEDIVSPPCPPAFGFCPLVQEVLEEKRNGLTLARSRPSHTHGGSGPAALLIFPPAAAGAGVVATDLRPRSNQGLMGWGRDPSGVGTPAAAARKGTRLYCSPQIPPSLPSAHTQWTG
jgi:hypothetical protein